MLSAIFRTVIIYLVVVAAMRLMGKRQLGEMQPSELVTTFLISNVASICIDEPDLPLISSLVPIFLIAALEILNSSAACRFPRYAGVLYGQPITVLRNGVVDQEALAYLRLTSADLMEALRGLDIDTPAKVAWGVVEPNGRVSVAKRPATGEPPPMLPILVDRQFFADNLAALGFDDAWLTGLLTRNGLTRSGVLVLLHNGQDMLLIPKKAVRKGGQPK